MNSDTTKQPTDVITEFLGKVPHAPGCSTGMHSAAFSLECSCGLADAQLAADDVAHLLDRFADTAQELVDKWEELGDDIAWWASELYTILGELPAQERDE